MKPVLNKVLEAVNEPLAKLEINTFNIPTYVLVDEPQIVCPKQGRYWRLPLWMYKDVILTYNELSSAAQKDGGFMGTSHYPQIYLYEVWKESDCCYYMAGYMYVVERQSKPLNLIKHELNNPQAT